MNPSLARVAALALLFATAGASANGTTAHPLAAPTTAATTATAAPAPAPLRPYVARYQLSRSGLRLAEGTFEVRTDGDHTYLYVSRSKPVGIASLFRSDDILEQTRWQWLNDTVHPLDYRLDHTGIDKPRHVHISFDWPSRRVINDVNGSRWKMNIPPDTLDKLSVQLALSLALKRGERGPFQFPVADGGKLKTYYFTVEGEEKVKTPAGRFDAVRVRRDQDKRRTVLWFVPSLDWLPVRLDQLAKHMSMQLVSVEWKKK